MAISLKDAMKLFHVEDMASADDPPSCNPVCREVREAIEAGMPEGQIVDILISEYRAAKWNACEKLDVARKARKPIKATPMPR